MTMIDASNYTRDELIEFLSNWKFGRELDIYDNNYFLMFANNSDINRWVILSTLNKKRISIREEFHIYDWSKFSTYKNTIAFIDCDYIKVVLDVFEFSKKYKILL